MTIHQDFAAALLDAAHAPPAGLRTWNGSDPAVRFAVYRNNALVALVDALADTFAVTQELVGVDFFRAMAQVFVRVQPPRSRILALYGEALPAFIEDFAPAAGLPYLADVARLEMLRVQAFHAADATALTPAQIAAALAAAESPAELRFGLHPSVRVLHSNYAMTSIWAAHQQDADFASIDPTLPESVLVLRPALAVEVVQLPRLHAEFVRLLALGSALGSATDMAGLSTSGTDLSAILALLMQRQAIVSIDSTRTDSP